RLLERELVAAVRLLRDDEEREALGALLRVRIRAAEDGEDVRASGEGAPRLSAVQHPAVDPADRLLLGAAAERRDVAADVRLGHADADHELAGGALREPLLLLALRAAGGERLREDLGARDERAGARERRGGELLRREDHREVPHLVAAVRLRHAEAEVAGLAE